MKNRKNEVSVLKLGFAVLFGRIVCMLVLAGTGALAYFCAELFRLSLDKSPAVWFFLRVLYAGIPVLFMAQAAWLFRDIRRYYFGHHFGN